MALTDIVPCCERYPLLSLDRAQQRKLPRLGQVHCLFRFGFGDLVRINASDADPFFVDLEHDRYSVRVRTVKDVLEDKDDKLHRRKIVVVQQHLEELGFFELCLLLGQDLGVVFGKVSSHDGQFA